MQNIQLTTKIEEDGILRVQMPAEVKNIQLEVLIVFQPTPQKERTTRHQGWPPDFFDKRAVVPTLPSQLMRLEYRQN